jgi:hypothetical protein
MQMDVTAILEAPLQPEPEPPLQGRPPPMFSDGWTRDGFGGQPGGWR